ncbi:hypothetical protein Nepgr_014775 [Nepenthes gracilis]|uniref:Uncharacterized protein n=1 Tax=Nepenthes gracilis TaxID=150966 RepID=A0AAD3SLQ7_NEPGR|nr:hypothetical protein Nepgr_014775 [Nepenthes gracilis]
MDACEAKEELYSNTTAVNTLKPPLVPAEKNNELPHGGLEQEKLVQGICLLLQQHRLRFLGGANRRNFHEHAIHHPNQLQKEPFLQSGGDLPPHLRRFAHLHRFKSDAISIPVSKKEKQISHALLDRTLKPSSNVARMASPSRTSPSTPSRGISPSRIRPSSPIRHSNNNTPSVLSFIADIKNGKRGANQLENAHQLRLLYNRYLQWRFANARADAALFAQIVTVEKTLYRVWRTNLSLWDFVITKRIDLQKLQLELKLNLVLNEQLAYLEDWDLLERDHSTCLTGVIKDLEINPLRHLLSQLASRHFLSNCKSVMYLTNNRFEYSNTAPQIPNRLALYILRH